jgi:hypothetical protein
MQALDNHIKCATLRRSCTTDTKKPNNISGAYKALVSVVRLLACGYKYLKLVVDIQNYAVILKT